MLASLSAILALGLAEFLCRPLFPSWRPASGDRLFWQYDAVLGWFHQPGSSGTFNHPDFSVAVHHNSAGFRDAEIGPLSPEQKRILLLGDSFAWGYGVEMPETLAEQLEKRLPQWDVLNCGVSGYGTDQEMLLYKEKLRGIAAHAVVLLVCENDLENNVHNVQYWHNKPLFQEKGGHLSYPEKAVPKPSMIQRLGKSILGRTYLYARIYRGVIKPLSKRNAGDARTTTANPTLDFASPRPDAETDTHEPGQSTTKASRLFRYLLQEFASSVSADGRRFIVVSVPASPLAETFFKTVTSELAIDYLSLAPYFSKTNEATSFPHDRHWNAAGHKLAAAALADFLTRDLPPDDTLPPAPRQASDEMPVQ